jgi:hypothetical protein
LVFLRNLKVGCSARQNLSHVLLSVALDSAKEKVVKVKKPATLLAVRLAAYDVVLGSTRSANEAVNFFRLFARDFY